jgi:hypothetical protein
VNKLGYVDRYREEQETWHKDGFRYRPEMFKTWSKKKQYEAYLRGAKSHWNSPNSTDIHSIRKIRNIKDYILKYVTKDETSVSLIEEKIKKLETKLSVCTDKKMSRQFILRIKRLVLKLKKVRSQELVKGRIWGCSQDLSDIKGSRLDVDSQMMSELEKVYESSECKHYHDTYFDIFYINFEDLPLHGGNLLFKYFCDYLFNRFNYSYQSSINL